MLINYYIFVISTKCPIKWYAVSIIFLIYTSFLTLFTFLAYKVKRITLLYFIFGKVFFYINIFTFLSVLTYLFMFLRIFRPIRNVHFNLF